MLLKALRNGLGYIIVFVDWVTRSKPIQRTPEDQTQAQDAMASLSLYQLYACPFCIKTRRALHKLNVNLEINDIGRQKTHREALKNGGGRVKVPCLKIEDGSDTRWLYESNDIIAFLQQRVLSS